MRFTIALLFVFGLFKISSSKTTKYCVDVQNNYRGKMDNDFVRILDNNGGNCQEAYEYTTIKEDEILSSSKYYQCLRGKMTYYSPIKVTFNEYG